MDDILVVARLPKGTREFVRVAVRNDNGRPRVDLRICNSITGAPGPKGLSLPPAMVPDLVRALESAEAALLRPEAPA